MRAHDSEFHQNGIWKQQSWSPSLSRSFHCLHRSKSRSNPSFPPPSFSTPSSSSSSCCVSPASISRYDLASLTVQNEKTRVAFLVEWVGTLRALEEHRSIPPWLETGLMNEIAGRRFNLIEKMNETIKGEKSKKNEKSSRDDLIFDRVTTKLANPSCISCLQIILLFINIILHKYYIFQDYLILKTSKLE